MSQPSTRLVFLPLKPTRHHTSAVFFQQCRAKSTSTPPLARSTAVTRRSHPQLFSHEHLPLESRSSRPFSTTLSWRATVVKQNPRADDDGKDMTIEISETAANVRLHLGLAPRSVTDCQAEITPDHECSTKEELSRILVSPRISPSRYRHLGRLPWISIPHVIRACRENRPRGGHDICIRRNRGRRACGGSHGLCLAGVVERKYD